MISSVREITALRGQENLLAEFTDFDERVDHDLTLLRQALDKQPLTREVPELETHMCFVEAYRDKVARRYCLASCFVEHAKSHFFLLPKGDGVTREDREAYQKSLTAGMLGRKNDMEQLLQSIDSRVNLVKKLLGPEYAIGGRRLSQ